ncbi:dystrobrevin beta isoform X1 [Drosophila nasuta]|uniref:Dystrobrevin beta isoform X1 n=1 Tax=Drosophila albomicans TaxID=7291 RepID=A0A9C6T877_DROAB|nr:dystrobrevin beta isoform X1 [Drosophila albomicans]XP_060653611.1 dystrobrevin beta isoform X1 [Drosophila nasuta]
MMELEPRVAILQDLRLQTFDSIRFASYRTASKLRYIQKSTNLHLVDIWNVIEAFRENGLNTLEPQSEVSVARLETLVSSLYHNLNKRLPTAQQVPVDSKAGLLLNWLLAAYTTDNSGKIRVFSIKVALATMCSGKLVDKLRYIFSQISDGAGQLVAWKLSEFLREVLALPAAVYESPTFHYKEGLEEEIFPAENKVTVNDFMATLMSEPGPSCLVWLPLLHRLATVETIVHPTICSVCHKENFTGFRYRCQRCHAYQLCQECFWHGKTSLNHQNDHEVKEYSSYKSPSKQIGHSLRKSFRCVPEKTTQVLPRFPDQPEKTLNLSHIVPPSPLPSHNGFSDPALGHLHGPGPGPGHGGIFDRSSTLDSRATGRSLDTTMSRVAAASANDEEHRLIARYAARLAQENRAPSNMPNAESITPIGTDNSRAQRELIAQLESKNKEIMREIARLRRQQETEQMAPENPALINELRALRQRKGELEGHLGALQDSRRQLMEQLEGLMRMLKNQQTASPRSTPNSSPRSGKSPPMPGGGGSAAANAAAAGAGVLGTSPMSALHAQQLQQMQQHPMLRSTQQQLLQAQQSQQAAAGMPGHAPFSQSQLEQLNQISSDMRSAFAANGSATPPPLMGSANPNADAELNEAADNITSAISTMVSDLNAGQGTTNSLAQARFILPLEYRHIEGGESPTSSAGSASDCNCQVYEQSFCAGEDYECQGAVAAPADPFNDVNVCNDDELLSPIQFDYNFGQSDEQSQVNRILGYRHHPELFIDDDQAGFPALHEIDFDESQSYNPEWNEKANANSQWQEQFAQWSLNSQKN